MQHAYVRNGAIVAASRTAILEAILEDGGERRDPSWFDRTGSAEKKSLRVYEVNDQKPVTVPDFVDAVPLNLVYDGELDTVLQPYALQEMEVGAARILLKRRITEKHRDRILNGTVELSGKALATHNDAYSELEKAVVRATVAPFNAVTRAGDLVTFDPTTAHAALAAVDTYRDACVDREAVLYGQVASAVDVADLRAINIESGWP